VTQAGSTCPKCKANRLRTRSSHQHGEHHQVRYLECCGCDYKTKAIVPADAVWRRSLVPYKQER
jgi:Zn ribbon nucleic-acid-binding protein